jgi:carbonic anhydrase
MLTRRLFCGCLAGTIGFAATAAHAQTADACAVFTPERQKEVTPDAAIAALRAGNERVMAGTTINCNRAAQARETAKGQAPIAAVIGCIDSRAAPELVFDQRIGDIFAARVAGNIINVDIIGSVEYATKVAGAKAIVVLGHSNCGAIKGAVDKVKLGNITALLKNFEPALKAVGKVEGHYDSHNDELVQKVAEANVRLTAQSLLKRSKIIKELVDGGQVKVATAMHDVATGKVTWL